jgi:hypothetical protein
MTLGQETNGPPVASTVADRIAVKNDAPAHHFKKFGGQSGATVTNRTDTDVRISA